MKKVPNLAIELLHLYKAADIDITPAGTLLLTPFATGQIVTMLAALDPEASELLVKILKKLDDTLALKAVRDLHARHMAKPNYSADLKQALRLH